ncbi:acyl-CoA dehydrogenase [Alkalihalophilus pseudofirmus OF4]|jgi:acyl-CoA dehydrogenase|uniref:Acyl-CoA dehydrogenase n=2 Tax=Alkalihalophilus TaxID=2893060 RepID=D3FSB1_ALKPO|nr:MULTISPECIES: acyl-CoA dehydrogenase family protein [Alkalihalophilus]ADC51746.1 acyl-CoA dehydrogenase [Alkalihalophilus pseudofirmus OF4]ERN53709.1 acyl-CoA dehydrogenase [Alkalihalophilus marmarensis DSM 21297]MED1600336.1 acyl-CoA dehydrogenase family protein [Alkalihalophilus marmarensis]
MGTASFLKEEHMIFRKAVRSFLEKEIKPHYEKWEKDGLIPRDIWYKLGGEGLLCPWLPEEYGGMGADFGYSFVLIEELERIGSSLVGVPLHNDVVVPYLWHYGNEEQKGRWLPKCATGEAVTAVAMTEPGTGSDLQAIKTTAILDGDSYVLNGSKTFISNGLHGDLFVVVCKTDPRAEPARAGISLLVVDGNSEGFIKGKKLDKVGLRSQDTLELTFEDVRVPKENLLGEAGKGFYYLMEQLQQERLIVAIAAVTAAEVTLDSTLTYVKERKAFGKPVGSFQHNQFTLVELATKGEIGRTFLHSLVERHMRGEDVVKEVSMAKWWLTDLAKETVSTCVQLHGGYGYMEEYEVARRSRDIPVSAIYAGTNEIMKTIIAKKMGL